MKRYCIKNTFPLDDGTTDETFAYASSPNNAIRELLLFKKNQWGIDTHISEESQVEDFIEHHGINPYTLAPEAVAFILSGPGLGRFVVMQEEVSDGPGRTLEEMMLLEDQLSKPQEHTFVYLTDDNVTLVETKNHSLASLRVLRYMDEGRERKAETLWEDQMRNILSRYLTRPKPDEGDATL